MSSFTTKTTFENSQIIRQTFEILNTNYLHFVSISLLFLPLTYLARVVIQFYVSSSIFSPNIDDTTFFDPFNLQIIKAIIANFDNLITIKSLNTTLLIIIFVLLPTITGIALVTFSTNQAIHNKPLTFSSAIKSLSRSYIYLFFTIIAGSIQLIFISLLFTLSPIVLTHGIKALGFQFDQVILSIFTNTLSSYGLLITIVYYMVIWGSAASIAVLESKSGFEPLMQSANQSKEFRSRSVSIVFLTGILIGPVFSLSAIAYNIEPKTKWYMILQVCAIYLQTSMMVLYYMVANTVLYVQYKVACDEELEKMMVDEDVLGEYVKVAVNEKDEDVVLNELTKGNTNKGFNYLMFMLCAVWMVVLLIVIIVLVV